MRRPLIAAIVLTVSLVAVFSAAAAAVVLDDEGIADGDRYFISYRTDGGALPEDYPEFYVAGSSATLPIPVKEGFWFAGWCTEAALTNPIAGIPADLRGHLILYAKWIEDSRVGTGWTMSVSGDYRNGDIPHSVEGSVTGGYDTIRDGLALITWDRDIEYSWPDGGWTNESSDSEWCHRITDGWTYSGNEFMGDERVTVWTMNGSTMWVKDLLIPMRMEVPIGTEGRIVYETTRVFDYEPDTSFLPQVRTEYPISVDVGMAEAGTPLFLYAEGEGFSGWYVNGRLVTTDRTLTVLMPSPSDVYTAAGPGGFIVIEDAEDLKDLGFGDATVTDESGATVSGSLDPGLYRAVRIDGGVTSTLAFLVDDERTFSFSWIYAGQRYTYTDSITLGQTVVYSYLYPNLPRFAQHTQAHMETFYTPDDPVIGRLADSLMEMGAGLDDVEYARFVLEFIQSVPYLEDIDSRGSHEYWKFPAETLWDGGGDCEDTAFLFGTIMGLSGYRTAFLLFSDHAMPAIALDTEGYTAEVDGYRFVLCETTRDSFEIGDTAPGHHPEDAIFACRIECLRWSIISVRHTPTHELPSFGADGTGQTERPSGTPHNQLRHGQ